MVADITLKAKNRIKEEKRGMKAGNIPCILYGKGIENVPLFVDGKNFGKIYEEAGESTILKLALEGGGERNVIIKEVQKDILNGMPIHVDFYQVRMDEEVEAEVELEFIGESPAVKELGGVLVKNVDKVEVKCLPGDLPSKIKVDISRINTFEDYIYVKDLNISEKVQIQIDPETVIAMVSPPRSEEELAELETEVKEDVTQVEGVVKEEKPEEGEESEEKPEKEKPEEKPKEKTEEKAEEKKG